MRLHTIKRCAIGMTAAILSVLSPYTSMAASATPSNPAKNSAETAFVRAKLDFINESGLSGVAEEMVEFADRDKWVKEGNYYYYIDPLEDGETVTFIKGVNIPKEWTEGTSGKTFHIVVTAEAVENMDGKANWSDGVVRTSTSGYTYKQRQLGYRTYETTELNVELNEYELTAYGKKVYENDKLVEPGQHVSKIAEITVHIKSKSSTDGGHGDRDYGGGGRSSGGRGGTEVRRIGGGSEVHPLGGTSPIASVWRIFTGDDSMLVPVLAAGLALCAILIAVLYKKKKEDAEGNSIDH